MKIVSDHSGSIEVDAGGKRGTKFTIVLPASDRDTTNGRMGR